MFLTVLVWMNLYLSLSLSLPEATTQLNILILLLLCTVVVLDAGYTLRLPGSSKNNDDAWDSPSEPLFVLVSSTAFTFGA